MPGLFSDLSTTGVRSGNCLVVPLVRIGEIVFRLRSIGDGLRARWPSRTRYSDVSSLGRSLAAPGLGQAALIRGRSDSGGAEVDLLVDFFAHGSGMVIVIVPRASLSCAVDAMSPLPWAR